MIRKYVLPLLAVVGVVFAIYTVRASNKKPPESQPVAEPPFAPFRSYVAGAGIVEPRSENIEIGTGVGGVVTAVKVKVGDRVKKDDPLFVVRERTLRAQLAAEKVAVRVAQARAEEAEALLAEAQNSLAKWEAITDPRAVSKEDLDQRRYAVKSAEARALAAAAEVEAAEAQVAVTEADLDRHTIKSPIDGEVLQVKIRPGEYAMAGVLQDPLMILGDTEVLHVRVDVDENDARRLWTQEEPAASEDADAARSAEPGAAGGWRLRTEAKARAYVRGSRELYADLEFVRVEPYVVPKRSLTGETTERVDTRVLQLLYAFSRDQLPVYPGQQMDVFIEVPTPADAPAETAAVDEGANVQ